MECNLQFVFDKLKEHYFMKKLKLYYYTVVWAENNVLKDVSFTISNESRLILINRSAMVRPRNQLVSLMFHILIHIYLNVVSKGAIKINTHNDEYRDIMLFLNSTLDLRISVVQKHTKFLGL